MTSPAPTSSATPSPSLLRVWLQLFRAPNLFTVAGDPLAGYLLASGGTLQFRTLLPILASLCFYMAGLLHNDLADLAEDRKERPKRPLPSGGARPVFVALAAAVLVLVGLLICGSFLFAGAMRWDGPLWIGGAIVLAVFSYNAFLKRLAIVGPLAMGICRGLSLLLGAVAALPSGPLDLDTSAVVAAAILTAYIAAVTHLARDETRPETISGWVKLLPGFVLIGATCAWLADRLMVERLAAQGGFGAFTGVGLLVMTTFAALMLGSRLKKHPKLPIPPAIGEFIRLLLPLQAAFCATPGTQTSLILCILLLTLWPIARVVSKRFYAS
ncbi:MAG: UbiA family prenyltransferase [Chthoniobacteraceae bacterium]